jgi:hypothetical protein
LLELDRRYLAFAAGLPPPLDSLALDRRSFIGPESQPFSSLQAVHPLAFRLPWLFRPAFPAIAAEAWLDISEASTFLIMGGLLQDAYLDGPEAAHPASPLLHQQLYSAALRKLHHLFAGSSAFWPYFDTYLNEYTTALLREREHRGQVAAYDLDLMYDIGRGKFALCKMVTTALAVKAKANAWIPHLERAVDALGAAMQLADDIVDWAEDYQRGHYTLPLTAVIPAEQWPQPTLSLAEIEQRLKESTVPETLLQQAVDWFQQALDAVTALACPAWVDFVSHRLSRAAYYQRALIAAKVMNLLAGAHTAGVSFSSGPPPPTA